MGVVCFATGRTPAKPVDPRRKIPKLAQAGRWKEAVALADRNAGASDALLKDAVDGIACQLLQVWCLCTHSQLHQGDYPCCKGFTDLSEYDVQEGFADEAEGQDSTKLTAITSDKTFLWECLHRITDKDASARFVMQHLGTTHHGSSLVITFDSYDTSCSEALSCFACSVLKDILIAS